VRTENEVSARLSRLDTSDGVKGSGGNLKRKLKGMKPVDFAVAKFARTRRRDESPKWLIL
jgi:hypothetical protein